MQKSHERAKDIKGYQHKRYLTSPFTQEAIIKNCTGILDQEEDVHEDMWYNWKKLLLIVSTVICL